MPPLPPYIKIVPTIPRCLFSAISGREPVDAELGRTGERARLAMAKMVRKGDLPRKTCLHCARPFAWRKKWERVWDEVKYCSQRCRQEAKA